jgi:uncharacterized OsmC-like protein
MPVASTVEEGNMTTANTLNDVNLAAVGSLVGAIQQEPAKAATLWQSIVTWKGGFRAEAQSRQFAPVAHDEPFTLGGENTAPNPVEHLLGALGSCLVIGYAANATSAGIRIEDLKIELEGDLDLHTFLGLNPEGHAGFAGIKARVNIKTDATPEAVEELHRKVVATSPVGHTVSRQVGVNVELSRAEA